MIKPATVTGVLHAAATELLSKKKNVVAANMPIEITQNVIPTKSSGANIDVFAFAALDNSTKATRTKTKIFKISWGTNVYRDFCSRFFQE